MDVINDIATQVARGSRSIFGVMIESNIVGGRQDVIDTQALTYGQSITDACISWEDTERALEGLADAVVKSGRL
jgi:3-deoxy-7-phosphoheptulonate synthase